MGGWEPKSESGQPAKIEEWDDERFVRGCLPDLLLHSSFPYPHPSAPQSSGLSLLPSFRAQTSCFKSKRGSSRRGSSQSSGSKDKELELLSKPSPIFVPDKAEEPPSSVKSFELDDALGPFLKFFKPRDFEEKDEIWESGKIASGERGVLKVDVVKADEEKKIGVEYYEPKVGDLVVGVVVSGNENKLDVNVGADMLGTMLTKDVLPFYDGEMAYLCCDLGKDTKDFMVNGKMGLVKDEVAMEGGKVSGRPVVEMGTVLFAEVLGRTLSGRPLLSSRRMFRRVAWHRVRQIKQFNEPIEVMIFEWNTGGLLTRIEGLRAFLPKLELMNRVSSFADLKEIGLLHISNITQGRITSVEDVLEVDEKVKVLVIKPTYPKKITLSIADLESEPGLFLSDKRVFSEAEEMAKKYRRRTAVVPAIQNADQSPEEVLPFDDEAGSYANWEWFKFEPSDVPKIS
ncbi:hypothetical protein HPP92_022945 [Vanilla planifolia]|uniref:Uncharacterized protein n=1 Tax=Vanilla planifolia TaxID=51239 RepID=A0A835PV36_VANPL|nr:hypothetical protein HPP92_022945 [Vanilla planifolia]